MHCVLLPFLNAWKIFICLVKKLVEPISWNWLPQKLPCSYLSVLSPLQIHVCLFSNFMMQRNIFSEERKEGPTQGHTGLHLQCHKHSWSPTFKDTSTVSSISTSQLLLTIGQWQNLLCISVLESLTSYTKIIWVSEGFVLIILILYSHNRKYMPLLF